jgi:beta-glucosidase-like glycosyl hydrolase
MRDIHLTLEQKIGQLFVVGFQGRLPDADTRSLLRTIQPGGFLLYQRNIESFDQIYDLTTGLRGDVGHHTVSRDRPRRRTRRPAETYLRQHAVDGGTR